MTLASRSPNRAVIHVVRLLSRAPVLLPSPPVSHRYPLACPPEVPEVAARRLRRAGVAGHPPGAAWRLTSANPAPHPINQVVRCPCGLIVATRGRIAALRDILGHAGQQFRHMLDEAGDDVIAAPDLFRSGFQLRVKKPEVVIHLGQARFVASDELARQRCPGVCPCPSWRCPGGRPEQVRVAVQAPGRATGHRSSCRRRAPRDAAVVGRHQG